MSNKCVNIFRCIWHFSNDLSNEDVKGHLGFSRGYLHGYDYGALAGNLRPAFDAAKRTDVLEPFLRIQGKLGKIMELSGILVLRMTLLCLWKSSQAVLFTFLFPL